MTPLDIEAEALKLEPEERARLAERLLQSLEDLTEEEADRLWGAEADRRDKEMDDDATLGRSAEDVFRDAKARHK